jgi:hypothetical protein
MPWAGKRRTVGDLVITTEPVTALCRKCDTMVQATSVSVNRGGHRVSDKWTCPCGNVLHDWTYDPTRPKAPTEKPKPKGQMGLF